MREDLAEQVYPFFRQGLNLQQRLKAGEHLDLLKEQTELKRRLRAIPGEPPDRTSLQDSNAFLGVRYPLVCWIDEIIILDSPWKEEWNERKIEESLYGTNERAYRF